MPRIDVARLPVRRGSGYPAPYDREPAERLRRRLGDAGGLTDFGVNLLELPPGAWSSQRHWHTAEDEFVYVLEGEVTLVTDAGPEILRAGDCVAFARGVADGHHLVNNSGATVRCLEIGSRRDEDSCFYPDIDLKFEAEDGHFAHRDGTPYPAR